MKYRLQLLAVVGLVAITVAAYLPALHGGFIWDDDDHLTANAAVAAPDGLRQIWSSLRVSRYYPLTLTTFWLEHRAWGLEPLPYHAVNILLQVASAVGLFFVLRRLQVRGAWVGAALWAIHPVNVESVAWVTELKNTQSGLFFLLAIGCYLGFDERRRPGGYAAALLCFAAALLSKPSTVVLPVVLLGCVWWRRRRLTRGDWLAVVPFFVLSLGMSLLTVAEQRRHVSGAPVHEWSLGLADRLVVAGRAFWFYAAKLFWPVNLTFVYPRWTIRAGDWLAWLPLAGVLVAGWMLWRFRSRGWARAGLFGVGYFGVCLLPVLGFFDVFYFRYSFVADHFQYLASAGLLALGAAAGATAIRGPWLRGILAGVVLAGLGVLSWQHSRVFRDDEALWRDTLAKNPGAPIAHNNLGTILRARGEDELGLEQYRRALELDPDYVEAHNNLGNVLVKQGRTEEALAHYREAMRIDPGYTRTYYNLAVLYVQQGRTEEAIANYDQAIRLNAGYVEAYYNLGVLLGKLGRYGEAVRCFGEAARIAPDLAEAHYNWGFALANLGKPAEAIPHYREAVRLAPGLASAHYRLGLALARTGRTGEARGELETALRLQPGSAQVRQALADLGAE